MKRIVFTNTFYYYFLLFGLTGMLLWHLFVGMATGLILNIGWIPIAIEFVLLYLVSEKLAIARIGVIAWAVVFLILASLIKIGGSVLENWATNFVHLFNGGFLFHLIKCLSGAYILFGTRHFIVEASD